jgi:two-component system chemotaxis response regulator CheY
LKPYGTCDFAKDGLEAIDAFEQRFNSDEPYDLVCLDISMPIMDGHTTLKEIRRLESSRGLDHACKVIMITAIRSIRTVMEAFGDMCDAYFPKPLNKKKFYHELDSLGLLSR